MRGLVLHVIVVLAIATGLQGAAADEPGASLKLPSKVIGREIAPFLKSANNAIRRKDWDLAAEQLAKADALPTKSDFEQGLIDSMRKVILARTVTPAFRLENPAEISLQRKRAAVP